MTEKRAERGVDTSPEEADRGSGPVDPTGHVSSGVQVGPLRGADDRPVARTDETMPQEAPAGSEDDGE